MVKRKNTRAKKRSNAILQLAGIASIFIVSAFLYREGLMNTAKTFSIVLFAFSSLLSFGAVTWLVYVIGKLKKAF